MSPCTAGSRVGFPFLTTPENWRSLSTDFAALVGSEQKLRSRSSSRRRVLTNVDTMCHDSRMPTMNIRQLRDTRKLKAWLRAGKTVELRGARPNHRPYRPCTATSAGYKLADFSARRKNIFGDRVLPGADLLIEERGRY